MLPLVLTIIQNTSRVFPNLRRTEVKTTYLFMLLIIRREFKEITITDGITIMET